MNAGDMDFFMLGGGPDIEKRAGIAGLTERVQIGWRDGFHGRNIKGIVLRSSKECVRSITNNIAPSFFQNGERLSLETSCMLVGLKETALKPTSRRSWR
jgi:hypothetical protein